MRYIADNDLHIHSYISGCAGHDPRQTKEAMLAYGVTNDFGVICVADHIWDKKGPGSCQLWRGDGQDIEKAKEILPLPQSKVCRFLFGIEVDIDYEGNIAVTPQEFDTFDFMIFAPSHLHLTGCAIDPKKWGNTPRERKLCYQERLHHLLSLDLPFHKCGLAHFTCTGLLTKDRLAEVLDEFTDEEYADIFRKVAACGMGVELNIWDLTTAYTPAEQESILRPYRIAKKMGCKFYFGGDAHCPEEFKNRKAQFEILIDLLNLTEDDKFAFVKEHLPKNNY